jgi:hypothetical protein
VAGGWRAQAGQSSGAATALKALWQAPDRLTCFWQLFEAFLSRLMVALACLETGMVAESGRVCFPKVVGCW